MKKILGLDLGTNSIGWSLIERDFANKKDKALGMGNILGMGSRIIPMSQDILDKFGQGQSHSQTADRTTYRSVRRLRQRHLLRRERLHRILNILNALPKHYADKLDFENKKGQFIDTVEVKLNYAEIEKNKYEFLFKDSFNEMVQEFKNTQPEIFYKKKNGEETKIPYDWTIYYLRKKALKEKISLEELAWILLNFNQKRGYYQLRGEDAEEDKTKLVEFHTLQVVSVSADEPNYKNEVWYRVKLENGWVYSRKSKTPLNDWIGKTKEFIVTTSLNEDGTVKTDKEGVEKRSFKAVNSEEDWIAIKKSTEERIEKSKLYVGAYIFDTLIKNLKQKINGKLVKTIERHFYKDELTTILEKQKEFHKELRDDNIFENCIKELYPNNYAQQNILRQKDFTNLFVNDIIFYQRPLKSKKSLIDGCKFESRTYKDKDGIIETKPIKTIHKSHPLYQELRLWQFVDNLRIYKREGFVDGKLTTDIDVTNEFIFDTKAKVSVFKVFNNREKITQKQFLGLKELLGKKLSEKEYRWNYVEDKEYPLNETRALFISKMKKHKGFDWEKYLTQNNEIKLWHLLYSISDKKELERALDNENSKLGLPVEIRQEFKKAKPFTNDYGAFSEKAIKKLLPLMRMGEYWDYYNIHSQTKERIKNIITGEYDESIRNRVREKAINLQDENDFAALPLWLASYIVYDRHSEDANNLQWKTPKQLKNYLTEFKQHSLRNPIVEQVVTETLRVVKDIWQYYGKGEEKFFDEIHVELGRDMKNPADKRKRLTEQITKNQNTNQRIRILLREFKSQGVEGVIPESPNQQEKLRIFEDDVLSQFSDKDLEKEKQDGIQIAKIIKLTEPTSREIEKYKLWLEQRYRSPYTGQVIPLSKLFTTDYEIEHIIPQSRYFDNSLGNKVICESEVNRFKDRMTAFEMISKHPNRLIDLGGNRSVKLFSLENYQDFVSRNFKTGSKKQNILLSEDVPEKFISRQLNDTRYISILIKGLLSNIVREDDEQEHTSKNVIAVTGAVTSILKNDWGLNDKWNELVEDRFKRMNEITGTNDFGYFDNEKGFFRTDVPLELKKDFSKKRIDHRHHALDALVVALATRNHVSYLSNEHAKSDNKRYDLRNKLRRVEEKQINERTIKISKEYFKPWNNFTTETKNSLDNIVVSFKQNLRVINKASNKYQVWKEDKGQLKRSIETQKGTNWAIRKPMHKETVYAKVNLRNKKDITINAAIDGYFKGDFVFVNKALKNKIKSLVNENYDSVRIKKYFKENRFNDEKLKKVSVYYQDEQFSAVRKKIDESFKSSKWIEESVTDTGAQKILVNHLKKYNNINENGKLKERPDLAFSEEGLIEMNKNIRELNGGKNHQPIYKARVYETLGNKFAVGIKGNKKDKYVEAAKGTNLFFAVYIGMNKKGEKVRQYITVPLNIVIERQKQGEGSVPDKYYDNNNIEYSLLFNLSPNDLVYVPTDEEQENINSINFNNLKIEQKKRIYKMEKASGKECYFIQHNISSLIKQYDSKTKFGEFGSQNKLQTTIEGEKIVEICFKLKVDSLGNINKA